MEFLAKNIKHIRKSFGQTQDEFAQKLGVKRSVIGSYEEERAIPKLNTLQDIANIFSITLDQLVNQDIANGALNNSKSNDTKVLSVIVDNTTQKELITLIPTKARAGYLSGYGDPEFVSHLPQFTIPVPELSAERTYRAFQISGESMLPIPSGAYIVCEFVEHVKYVDDGKTHIVISRDDGIVFKRTYKSTEQDNTLELVSDNPEFPPYTISYESVSEIWKALGYISFSLPRLAMPSIETIHNKLQMMEKEINKLK